MTTFRNAKVYWVAAVPAALDLFSTFFINVGLLWIVASELQMLRSSIVIFTALLTITYRKRHLKRFEWVGVLVVFGGEVIVGVACILGTTGSPTGGPAPWQAAVGIGVVVFAQFTQSLQAVIEEKLLHDLDAPPALLVGMQGAWGMLGTLLCMVVAYFLPGVEGQGLHEDTLDSLVMLARSVLLVGLLAAFTLCILGVNLAGMYITTVASALTRNILDPLCTLAIWLVNLFVHYVISPNYGEPWTIWGWLELAGFMFLCAGMAVYNEMVRLRCFHNSNPTALGGTVEETAQLLPSTPPPAVEPREVRQDFTSINGDPPLPLPGDVAEGFPSGDLYRTTEEDEVIRTIRPPDIFLGLGGPSPNAADPATQQPGCPGSPIVPRSYGGREWASPLAPTTPIPLGASLGAKFRAIRYGDGAAQDILEPADFNFA
ncbi:putative drug metabolite transporter superfamily [Paratrimastix pyriformis]|uniref:Drug metabolite transporter superfamily n=1 Tax=Paratrimastix pyriformis TaxID=342808 RepID=A0ABQ8UK04_9EUKA|nr:putative drug metabolite transporter superfamily [Paratrimastix pyriformis]